MCSYAAAGLAIAVIGLAASGYQISEQNQATKAENRSRSQSADNAVQSFRDQASSVNLRLQQEQEAAVNAKVENAKRAAEARATARVSSAQAGVSGISVDNLYQDFFRQEATYRAVTDTNLANSAAQSQNDLKGIRATANDRVAAFRPEPIPDYLSAGIRIGAAGYDAYGKYRDATTTTSTGDRRS